MFASDQGFKGLFKNRRFALYGRMWLPNGDVARLIGKAGGHVCISPEPGDFIVFSTVVLVPLDKIGLLYDFKKSPVSEHLQSWIERGARPLAERDLKEALQGSTALSRRRFEQVRAEVLGISNTCRDVMALLDEVIEGDGR